MKQEEKLEKAKELYTTANADQRYILESLFPELAESEDEKIRKELIAFIKKRDRSGCDYDYDKWIVWLEKQGNKSVNIDIESMVSSYEQRLESKGAIKNSPLYNLSSTAFRHGIENTLDELNLKQSEQTPADKVKSKFKVGDWIVCEITGSVYQIKNCIENVSNHKYGYELTNGGYIGSDDVNLYNFWTIQDAKDGDVLRLGCVIAIFKKYIGQEKCICYCSINENKGFEIPIEDGEDNVYGCINTTPATKEQRDLLFSKMKEAGYEWDAEKKEVNKLINWRVDRFYEELNNPYND